MNLSTKLKQSLQHALISGICFLLASEVCIMLVKATFSLSGYQFMPFNWQIWHSFMLIGTSVWTLFRGIHHYYDEFTHIPSFTLAGLVLSSWMAIFSISPLLLSTTMQALTLGTTFFSMLLASILMLANFIFLWLMTSIIWNSLNVFSVRYHLFR